MALTGKTGADAVFKALKRICIVLAHFENKLMAVIDQAEADDAITPAQATTCRDLLALASAACAAFQLLAEYSGF